MNYGIYQGEDGVIMELAALRGIAGLLHEFGEYGGIEDHKTTMLDGLGIALEGIAYRIEKHTEEAEWERRDTDEQLEQKRGNSGIWVMRELRQMGLTGREDIEMALLMLRGSIQRQREAEKAEQEQRLKGEDAPKKGRKNGQGEG